MSLPVKRESTIVLESEFEDNEGKEQEEKEEERPVPPTPLALLGKRKDYVSSYADQLYKEAMEEESAIDKNPNHHPVTTAWKPYAKILKANLLDAINNRENDWSLFNHHRALQDRKLAEAEDTIKKLKKEKTEILLLLGREGTSLSNYDLLLEERHGLQLQVEELQQILDDTENAIVANRQREHSRAEARRRSERVRDQVQIHDGVGAFVPSSERRRPYYRTRNLTSSFMI